MTDKIILDSVGKFLERVRMASRSRTKEIRLSISEAEDIAISISQLLSNENQHSQEIIKLQRELLEYQKRLTPTGTLDIDADGGGF